jgi:uncharacterized membrane protein
MKKEYHIKESYLLVILLIFFVLMMIDAPSFFTSKITFKKILGLMVFISLGVGMAQYYLKLNKERFLKMKKEKFLKVIVSSKKESIPDKILKYIFVVFLIMLFLGLIMSNKNIII